MNNSLQYQLYCAKLLLEKKCLDYGHTLDHFYSDPISCGKEFMLESIDIIRELKRISLAIQDEEWIGSNIVRLR